jgi:uncharacterized protein (DUF885 family)
MKLLKRFVTGVLSAAMICTANLIPVQADEGKSFDSFLEDEFVTAMESDYMTMHYQVKDYEALGITKPELTAGSAKWSDYQDNVDDAETSLKKLHTFDYDSLSDSQKVDYKAYEQNLEYTITLDSHPYFDFWFNSADGMIGNLTTNFTEFTFYTKQDIDDYLTVLATADEYIDDAMTITKKQAKAGYFMTDSMLSDTDDFIEKFVAKTDDNEMIKVFNENVEAFDGLTADEISAYEEKNKDIVLNQYIPAFKNAETELNDLKGSRDGEYNVSSLKDGEAYYTALAQYKTSMSTDVQGMLDVCNNYLDGAINDFYTLNNTITDSEISETIDMDTPEEVLSYLQKHMDSYPDGPDVTYKATYLDSSVANDSTVAYYLHPPIDDLTDNVIKINGSNISDTNEMYMTLAHEGFPGHLYQITYYLNTKPSNIRTALTNYGYTEGWGMYSELQAIQESTLSQNAKDYNSLDTAISYVLDAAADLGVNGLGWSKDDLANYLEQLGLNSGAADSLYDFVTEEPGTLLPYGVGLAEYETLEQKAQDKLGSSYDAKEFHKVLLDNGDRPFDMVEADVDAWLNNTTADYGNPDSDDVSTETESSSSEDSAVTTDWIKYGSIGALVAVIGIIALFWARKYRKDDPFRL